MRMSFSYGTSQFLLYAARCEAHSPRYAASIAKAARSVNADVQRCNLNADGRTITSKRKQLCNLGTCPGPAAHANLSDEFVYAGATAPSPGAAAPYGLKQRKRRRDEVTRHPDRHGYTAGVRSDSA